MSALCEHPARLQLDDRAMLTQWKPAYKHGAAMQASLSLIGTILGLVAWWQSGTGSGLPARSALIAPWPFTLLVIKPTNDTLLATDPQQAGPTTPRPDRKMGTPARGSHRARRPRRRFVFRRFAFLNFAKICRITTCPPRSTNHRSPTSKFPSPRTKRRILDIAKEKLGIAAENLDPYGHYKAKVSMDFVKSLQSKKNGKLILVTAITPTPAGEGKTTTTVGLTDALNHIGKKAMLCLREPSLGPSFGMKGGAAGGGYAQVIPMEDINLHFTGDFHAITSAHNLLSALIDNHIYWGNALGIDSRRVVWRRVMDMNDRALREIVCSLGGVANGYPREAGFDITVASEVMAIFCLAKDLDDLKERLGNIIVAYTRDRKPVRAQDLKAHGAMAALLKEAIAPNLVQTLEGTPAFIHGGPFANIAHGCNSVVATTTALKLADYVVTEAGFGADLGAEKFIDIKCRKAGLAPDCVVIVATIRALKMHGGVKKDDLKKEDLKALEAGMANLARHVENVKKFGLPAVVSINRFSADTDAEITLVKDKCKALGVEALMADHWAMGGEGAADVAQGGGEDHRREQGQAEAALCRRHAAVREDPHHRQGNLSRQRRHRRQVGEGPAQDLGRDGLRQAAGLHRQDAVFLLDQSGRQGRADRSHHQCARGAALRRRGIRGGDLR